LACEESTRPFELTAATPAAPTSAPTAGSPPPPTLPRNGSLAAELRLDELCTDPRALDLDAFNAPNGGFVVAKDLDYVRARFRDAFATRSASEMEAALNAIGVPAARVRTLKEFLADAPGRVTLPIFDLSDNDGKTPGLGFALKRDGAIAPTGAPALGADNLDLLTPAVVKLRQN
jgi:crotonobetainyl-CoA:carnitine CoA-transferase CaiB-like acyl-CoA transferase